MKERDIVDFSKFYKNKDGYLVDENNEEVGCEICYTHKKAYEKFKVDEDLNVEKISSPICPICGEPLSRRYNNTTECFNAVVSEYNGSNPNGNIGFYSIWECEHCKDYYGNKMTYALIPEPIIYNGNHDIFYTGGKYYIRTPEEEELLELVKAKVMPSIMQYIRRVINPKDGFDKSLSEDNLKYWCSNDIEHAIAEWMYNHGFKK